MPLGVRVRFRSRDAGQGERVLHQLPVRLGRNAMNDCVITHPFVSDFHAMIEWFDGELCVRDLNSRNGIHDRNLSRLPAGRSIPLGALGNGFVVGRAVEVEVEPFEAHVEVGERPPSSVHGAVLGNPAALSIGRAGGLPPLPPLSMGPQGMGQHAPPPPPAYVPPVSGGAMSRSLPMLAPLASMPMPGGAQHGPPHAHGGGPGGHNTQHLSMSMELLALLGLRELASSLVPGVPLETTGDVARLLTKMHDLVEMFCRCFVPLRDSRLGASRWARRMAGSKSASEVDYGVDPAAIAAALLDWRNQDYDGAEAAERILADVVVQQAALLESLMRGVGSLLEELSPDAIERALREDAIGGVFGRYRALWQTFKERFDHVSREENRAELLLGSETAAAYRKHLARQRGAGP
jgi:predicted component of type VI protein secretion system